MWGDKCLELLVELLSFADPKLPVQIYGKQPRNTVGENKSPETSQSCTTTNVGLMNNVIGLFESIVGSKVSQ
jgi:hypothetical protein